MLQKRRAPDVMLLTNSTLVVQLFFLMSSFLLAHKLLQQRARHEPLPPLRTFASTMLTRFVRLVSACVALLSHLGKKPVD